LETIIALGTVACNIAKKFEKHSEYEVYKIDHKPSKAKNYLKIEEHKRPEDYEHNPPNVGTFLESVDGEVLFVVCGASIASAAALVILQQIHEKCKISVLYISPELELLSESKSLQERATFGILQEYARSGLLERVYLVSNVNLDPLVEDASILGYHDSLNDVIVSSFHMINFFNHTDSVSDTFSEPLEISRISTFGLLNVESGEEKMFFPLDNIRETRYYYGIPEEKLAKEKGLHRKILGQMKEKASEEKRVSYGIYSTNYAHECAYILAHSSTVQQK